MSPHSFTSDLSIVQFQLHSPRNLPSNPSSLSPLFHPKKRKYLDLLINLSLSLSLSPPSIPVHPFRNAKLGERRILWQEAQTRRVESTRITREKARERVRKRGVEKNQRRVFPIPGIVNELEAGGENRARMNGEWRRRFHE